MENNEPKSQLTCVLTHACRPIVPSAVTEATLVLVLVLQQMFAPGKHSRSPSVFAPLPVCRHHLSHHPHVSAAGSDYMFVPHCLGSPQLHWGSGGGRGQQRAVRPEGFHSGGGKQQQTRTNGGFRSRRQHILRVVVSGCDATASRLRVSHYDVRTGPRIHH